MILKPDDAVGQVGVQHADLEIVRVSEFEVNLKKKEKKMAFKATSWSFVESKL